MNRSYRMKKIKYLSQSHGPLKEEDLLVFEERVGRLPDDYRDLLLEENGGVTRPHIEEDGAYLFYGIYDGPSDLRIEWSENFERYGRNFLPIATDPNSDHILLNMKDGSLSLNGKSISSSVPDFLKAHAKPIEHSGSITELIQNSELEKIENLIRERSINVNAQAKFGYNLIQYASMLRKEAVVSLLAENGADVTGCLHLMLKLRNINFSFIKIFLDHGADINERNSDGLRVIDVDSPWIDKIVEYYNSLNEM